MQVGETHLFSSDSFCFHDLEKINVFPTSSEDFIALPSVSSWEVWWNRKRKGILFSSDISCWDMNTLLHLRALSHLHLDPSHKSSSLSILDIPLPYSSASPSPALTPAQSLPLCCWAGISFPSITSMDLHWQGSLMANCTDFIWTSCSLWGTYRTRTAGSPVIHLWSSTEFPQVWESSLCLGHSQNPPGPSSIKWHLALWHLLTEAAGTPLPIYHCESCRNHLFKPPSLCQTGDTVWQCQKPLAGMDRHTEPGQSPGLYLEPELMVVHSAWGMERGLGGFTSSLGLSSPEMVCKGGCLLFAPPNKLLLPCYTVVIYPQQIEWLLMISPQDHCLML